MAVVSVTAAVLAAGVGETLTNLVALAGVFVLFLMILALAGVAYRTLRGDGIEWPSDQAEADPDDDGVRRGGDDEEWDFY